MGWDRWISETHVLWREMGVSGQPGRRLERTRGAWVMARTNCPTNSGESLASGTDAIKLWFPSMLDTVQGPRYLLSELITGKPHKKGQTGSLGTNASHGKVERVRGGGGWALGCAGKTTREKKGMSFFRDVDQNGPSVKGRFPASECICVCMCVCVHRGQLAASRRPACSDTRQHVFGCAPRPSRMCGCDLTKPELTGRTRHMGWRGGGAIDVRGAGQRH